MRKVIHFGEGAVRVGEPCVAQDVDPRLSGRGTAFRNAEPAS
jgi:hypothetical protein